MDEVKRVMGLWLLLWVRWEPLTWFERRRGGIWLSLSSITLPAGLRINCGGTTMGAGCGENTQRSVHWSTDDGGLDRGDGSGDRENGSDSGHRLQVGPAGLADRAEVRRVKIEEMWVIPPRFLN